MYLKQLCTPRESVFNRDLRDVVLDLSDLLKSKIDPEGFFEENYITSGMKTLLEKTFSRLDGSRDQASTFLLTQAMGGGKTHNMMALDDKDDPNFADTDYQLAAYAAALRVLTQCSDIEGQDITHELFRQREPGEKTAFEKVIDRAVEIASDHLVPTGIKRQYWKKLLATERLYLKGIELEKHMESRSGAFQELAKGFGVRNYTFLYASTKANSVRFKTGSEFKKSHLGKADFSASLTRNILFAIHETVRMEDAREGLKWFHTEVENYWDNRKMIADILKYLSGTNHISHMPHWKHDSDAALRLAGAVENDHGGRV